MKITSLSALESYIYSSVILPFKNLKVQSISSVSPLLDGSNHWAFSLSMEQIHGNFHHNFQRDRAREQAKTLVVLKAGGMTQVVADYDRRLRKVTIYQGAFQALDKGNYLMKRLEEAFRSNTPFEKVVINPGTRTADVYLDNEDPEEEALSSIPVWGDEGEDDNDSQDDEEDYDDLPF